MELTNDIKEILENVVYWETCPQDYKDRINAYLKSENETALNIDLVIWRCKEDVNNERGDKIFTNGLIYEVVDDYGSGGYLIDDRGNESRVSKFFFTSI